MNSNELKEWTKTFALRVVRLCRHFLSYPETKTIQYQLIKAATSVAANYRAACRARSKNEWYAKICIVSEEADESNFWLDFISNLDLIKESQTQELQALVIESERLMKLFAKAKGTTKKNKKLEEPSISYGIPDDWSEEE